MQNTEMQQESESSPFSRPSSIPLSAPQAQARSEREHSLTFIEIAKLHLQDYADINQNQFQMLNQHENQNIENTGKQTLYLKPHTTYVPIGTNFQTDIPEIMSSSKYLNSYNNIKNMERLNKLKMHDVKIGNQFYEKYGGIVENIFGEDRTYQQIAILQKAMEEIMGFNADKCTFQEYINIGKVSKNWQEIFKEKDLDLQKRFKKKKKKYKGSMDV